VRPSPPACDCSWTERDLIGSVPANVTIDSWPRGCPRGVYFQAATDKGLVMPKKLKLNKGETLEAFIARGGTPETYWAAKPEIRVRALQGHNYTPPPKMVPGKQSISGTAGAFKERSEHYDADAYKNADIRTNHRSIQDVTQTPEDEREYETREQREHREADEEARAAEVQNHKDALASSKEVTVKGRGGNGVASNIPGGTSTAQIARPYHEVKPDKPASLPAIFDLGFARTENTDTDPLYLQHLATNHKEETDKDRRRKLEERRISDPRDRRRISELTKKWTVLP
jgi:hypothetical protein